MTKTYEFTTEDIEYLRHGERGLKLRLYKPRGAGPFPAVVDVHGGAWGKGSLEECRGRDEALARAGLLVVGIDFRDGNDGYPTALVDINYAIRWVKARAAQLQTRTDLVGLSGQSSGGHLAMLAAMRPNDPRYTAIPLPAGSPAVDATVRCVAMSWAVINPLSRYRNALRERAKGVAWVGDIPERQSSFWKNDDNMSEGSPVLMLERGETVSTPPALWVQGQPDPIHDYRDPESPVELNEPERFAASYRKAGGTIELLYIEQAARTTAASHDPIAKFFLTQMPVAHAAEASA
ncbi:MAG TPA: alpha/beta hydrolase [Burkholderiales bacterium]|nr:alpha/beta hydrolase [Burkholderiales bacterium]